MQKMVKNTYFCFQIFLVIAGLIHLELALTGMVESYSSSLWYLMLIKSILILAVGILVETKVQLCSLLYGPQLGLDLLFLVSPFVPLRVVFILSAFLLLAIFLRILTSNYSKAPQPQAE